MKITKSKLKQLIKEELQSIMEADDERALRGHRVELRVQVRELGDAQLDLPARVVVLLELVGFRGGLTQQLLFAALDQVQNLTIAHVDELLGALRLEAATGWR